MKIFKIGENIVIVADEPPLGTVPESILEKIGPGEDMVVVGIEELRAAIEHAIPLDAKPGTPITITKENFNKTEEKL